MPRVRANGLEIEYDTFGDPKAAPLLLIMGLGAQMISWEEAFCEQLAARGFHVIRFDNRDAGLSTKMEAAGEPDLMAAFSGNLKPAYELDDLALDAVGVLDALGIHSAHIVGASMGGMLHRTAGGTPARRPSPFAHFDHVGPGRDRCGGAEAGGARRADDIAAAHA